MSLKIRNIQLGKDKPKVIVPIVGANKNEIIDEIKAIKLNNIDMVEFRADFFEEVLNLEELEKILFYIRKEFKDMPIIFTFRNKNEGGQKHISTSEYKDICEFVCKTKLIDIIDVEFLIDKIVVDEIIEYAHKNNVYVIISNHNFYKTPNKGELVNIFMNMDKTQADIVKIAVMPNSKLDIIELLSATVTVKDIINKPVISISMGELGAISRISGEVFGSCATFASIKKSSAPGQMNINDINTILEIINKI